MLTPTTALLGTLVAGALVGMVVYSMPGPPSKSPWWAAVLMGLVGAAIGRALLDFSFFRWHPHFLGGILGAVVLSVVWRMCMRRGNTAG